MWRSAGFVALKLQFLELRHGDTRSTAFDAAQPGVPGFSGVLAICSSRPPP
jgi:hypothetical protein